LRSRFRYDKDYFQLGNRWGNKLSFYFDCLKALNKTKEALLLQHIMKNIKNRIILRKKKEENIDIVDKEIKVYLKDFSTYMKVKGPNNEFEVDYLYFVNMEMLGDYEKIDQNNISQDLDTWLLKENHLTFNSQHEEERWWKYFDIALKEFFITDAENDVSFTFEEFVKHPELWGTQGSSGNSIKLGNKKYSNKFTNTKKAFASIVGSQQIVEKCKLMKKQRLKVNIKQELVKARGVVNSDIFTYLLMSYLSYFFERFMSHNKYCILLHKNNKAYMEMMQNTLNLRKTEYNMPVDQTSFDANVNHIMVHKCFDVLRSTYESRIREDDTHWVWEKMKNILTVGDVITDKGIKQFKNGIPSGWRWTALFDSAINYAQIKATEYVISESMLTFKINDIYVQGDDVQCKIDSKSSAEKFLSYYEKIGLKLNRLKIFCEKERTEYLRVVYDIKNQKVLGYPARILPSLFFSKPGGGDRMSLNSLISNWQKFRRRMKGWNDKFIFEQECIDCYRYINRKRHILKEKITMEDLKNYMTTEPYLGGIGEESEAFRNKRRLCIKEIEHKIDKMDISSLKRELDQEIQMRNDISIVTKKILSNYMLNELNWYGAEYKKEFQVIDQEEEYKKSDSSRIIICKTTRAKSFFDMNFIDSQSYQNICLSYKENDNNLNKPSFILDNKIAMDYFLIDNEKRLNWEKENNIYINKLDNGFKILERGSQAFKRLILLSNQNLLYYKKDNNGDVFNHMIKEIETSQTVNNYLCFVKMNRAKYYDLGRWIYDYQCPKVSIECSE
jgi:hypothetical protein